MTTNSTELLAYFWSLTAVLGGLGAMALGAWFGYTFDRAPLLGSAGRVYREGVEHVWSARREQIIAAAVRDEIIREVSRSRVTVPVRFIGGFGVGAGALPFGASVRRGAGFVDELLSLGSEAARDGDFSGALLLRSVAISGLKGGR